MILTTEPGCQAHAREANVTKREVGDTDRCGTSYMGGKPRWHWMGLAESQLQDGDALKYYCPEPETDWRHARPYGTDSKEDSSREETHDMLMRLGDTTSDMTVSQGCGTKAAPKRRTGNKSCFHTPGTR